MKAVTIEIDVKNDLSGVARGIWNQIKQTELKISNKKGSAIKFPAIYGLAAMTFFPLITVATILSMAQADLRIAVEKGN